MGLFDQKQTQFGTNLGQSGATQTATPWQPAIGGLNTLASQVTGKLNKGPAANPWLDSALSGTMSVANGGQMGVDPNLQAAMDDNAARAYTQVGRMGSAMGGFGGGANQAHLAREIASVNNPLLFANFQNQQGRQDAARGLLGQFGQYMDERQWMPQKNGASILGLLAQLGGTKDMSGWTTANTSGLTNKPSSPFQDVAGIGSIIGSIW